MIVGKIATREVLNKLDTQYIADQFIDINHTVLVFRCTPDGAEDESWEEDGIRHFIIELPYDLVLQMEDVRPMMLAKAMERLG